MTAIFLEQSLSAALSLTPKRKIFRHFSSSISSLLEDKSATALSTPAPATAASIPPKKWSLVPQARARSQVVNRLWMNRLVDKQKLLMGTSTDQTLIKTTPDPIDKKMIDSYVEEYLAFKSDPDVLAEYINVYGLIRFGKILEDLDALAGSISYAFADDGRSDTPPLTIVTASLDRIDLLEPITASEDVRLSGFVTSVGTSSMEVSIIMEIVPEGVEAALAHSNSRQQPPTLEEWVEARKSSRTLLAAKFTMVGRDQVTGKAAPINRLKLETSLERKLNERGILQKAKKKLAGQTSLSKQPPTVEEMYLIHSLYKEYIQYLDPSFHKSKPGDVVWMKDTIRQSLLICMPQDRNIHNNIFGGYLMRVAYELGHATSILFAGCPIEFLSLDDIVFKKPVAIGSLLSLTAQIIYTSGSNTMECKVRADVIDPLKSRMEGTENTNMFHFRFKTAATAPPPPSSSTSGSSSSNSSGSTPPAVARVIPRSYDESIRYLEGKRMADRHLENIEHNVSFLKDMK